MLQKFKVQYFRLILLFNMIKTKTRKPFCSGKLAKSNQCNGCKGQQDA